MAVERVPDVSDGGVDDVGRVDPLALDADRLGVDARHVENVLEQARQPIELGDRCARLRAPLLRRQVAAQVLHRDSDRGQRRSQVVTERRQQRAGQIGLLPYERRGVALGQELRPLDGNGDDAGDGVEGADVERRRRCREQPDRLRAMPQRDDEEVVVRSPARTWPPYAR